MSLFIQRKHTKRAKELLEEFIKNKSVIFVPQQAIAETIYVLGNIHKIDDSIQKLSRVEIKEMIESLINTPKIKVEKELSIREVLSLYCNLNIKFGDCLIYTTIKKNGIDTIATFDRDFDKMDISVVE